MNTYMYFKNIKSICYKTFVEQYYLLNITNIEIDFHLNVFIQTQFFFFLL